MTKQIIFALTLCAVICLVPYFSKAEESKESHPGSLIEPTFSEAVLKQHDKEPAQALILLDQVLSQDPKHIESLELKALILKQQGRTGDAIKAYNALGRLKSGSERAPYHFEIGVIYFGQKQYPKALPHFQKAIDYGFNITTSHFFLGLMAFTEGKMRDAETNLTQTADFGSGELAAAATFYLGVIDLKNGFGSSGVAKFINAKDQLDALSPSPFVEEIRKTIDKVLNGFDKNSWFGSLALLGQYDSNLPRLANSVTSLGTTPDPYLSKTSFKGVTFGSVGRTSSPLKTLQWIATYQGNYNYNLNSYAHGYEYFGNTLTFFLNYKALAKTSFGLKLSGSDTFQNVDQGNQIDTKWDNYLLAAELGPYMRFRFLKRFTATLEAFYRPKKNLLDSIDPTLSPSLSSGWSAYTRALFTFENTSEWFSPSLFFSFEDYEALGSDIASRTLTAGLSNSMRPLKNLSTSVALDFAPSVYHKKVGEYRRDNLFGAHINSTYTFNRFLSAQLNSNFAYNLSSIDQLYSYTQWDVASGIGLSF